MASVSNNNPTLPKTYFASPERLDQDTLEAQLTMIFQNPVTTGLLTTVSGLLAVLNEERQILAVNDLFMEKLGIEDQRNVLGLRPGQVLQCKYAELEPAGCGTTEYCSTCGAAIAMVSSLGLDKPVEQQCVISTVQKNQTDDLVFLVRSQPITINSKRFLLLFMQDTTRQQQRAALERTFFHDINNMLNSLVGASDLLVEEHPSEMAKMIQTASLRLIKEVAIQQVLAGGDTAAYEPQTSEFKVGRIIEEACALNKHHRAVRNLRIVDECSDPDASVTTDYSLLLRILSNMLLNACEASQEGDVIKIAAKRTDDATDFSVWNRQPIPEHIAKRVFQRNFSTKQKQGRGLGTFSMKLFGEKILGGKVWFTSEEAGTRFIIRIPQ